MSKREPDLLGYRIESLIIGVPGDWKTQGAAAEPAGARESFAPYSRLGLGKLSACAAAAFEGAMPMASTALPEPQGSSGTILWPMAARALTVSAESAKGSAAIVSGNHW